MVGNILSGLGLIAAGSCIIYFYNQIHKMFGPIQRAEDNIGDSRVIYVLFGCALIVIGVLMMFGIGAGSPVDDTQNMRIGQ